MIWKDIIKANVFETLFNKWKELSHSFDSASIKTL